MCRYFRAKLTGWLGWTRSLFPATGYTLGAFHHEMGITTTTSKVDFHFDLYWWLNTILISTLYHSTWFINRSQYCFYLSTSESGRFPLQWSSLWVESFTMYRKANPCKSVADGFKWLGSQSSFKHLATFFLIMMGYLSKV